jgi:aminoglycoside phosphotransferase (APT) family kinase protein
MSELYIRRDRPKRSLIKSVLQTLQPAATLGRVSRLRGGLSNHMFAVQYRPAAGRSGRFVVRLTSDWQRTPGENALREYSTLRRLSEAGIASPRPLLLDETGERLGQPGLVTSYDGRAIVNPVRHGPWLRGMARALAALHRLAPEHIDLTHLDEFKFGDVQRRIGEGVPDGLRDDVLAQKMHEALQETVGRVDWGPRCLVHDDYWPGNVVWRRGQVTIVDWTMAKIGDRREDVAQCRLDLAMTQGADDSDAFLCEYEAASGSKVDDVWFFDLLRGISALATYQGWVPGYLDSGLTYMTPELAEKRLRFFLEAALAQADPATWASR